MRFSLSLPEDREFDVVGFGLNAVDYLITVPRFPTFNTKTRVRSYDRMPGGQVSSAMVGAQRLGLRASYIGKVGNDDEGKLLIESLRAEGVECTNVMVAARGRTQTAVIIIEQVSGERTILWHHDDITHISSKEINREMITRGRLLHIDGFDTEAAILAATWAREAEMTVTIDLDTAYCGIDELLPLVDCLIISSELTDEFTGVKDERKGLKRLHEQYGCYLVAMTQGVRGALAYVEGEFIVSPAFRPPVCRDTTGAGDAFRAGFIYGLVKGLTVEKTLRTANAVAALQCREFGARAGLPIENELLHFLAENEAV